MQNEQTALDTVSTKLTRASASVPPELYQTLQQIAKQKKVSTAWVIRDALDRYVSDQWPLLSKKG